MVTLVALTGCDNNQGSPPTRQPPSSSTTASPSGQETSEGRGRCRQHIPFIATYLPDAFDKKVYKGRAKGYRRLDRRGQVVFHYRGNEGRAIEVRRPGTEFSELAQRDDAPTIEVLGTETAGFAPISPGGDDFIVQFTYPASAPSTNHCAIYSLNESGVPMSELKKVAEGLRPKR